MTTISNSTDYPPLPGIRIPEDWRKPGIVPVRLLSLVTDNGPFEAFTVNVSKKNRLLLRRSVLLATFIFIHPTIL